MLNTSSYNHIVVILSLSAFYDVVRIYARAIVAGMASGWYWKASMDNEKCYPVGSKLLLIWKYDYAIALDSTSKGPYDTFYCGLLKSRKDCFNEPVVLDMWSVKIAFRHLVSSLGKVLGECAFTSASPFSLYYSAATI
jgi:hypothetical protein